MSEAGKVERTGVKITATEESGSPWWSGNYECKKILVVGVRQEETGDGSTLSHQVGDVTVEGV